MPDTSKTSLIDPFGVQFDLAEGIMHDPQDQIVRHASDMRGYYADEAALEQLIATAGRPAALRNVRIAGAGRVRSGQVLHQQAVSRRRGRRVLHDQGTLPHGTGNRRDLPVPEGPGLMMMKLSDGTCRWEQFVPGRLVYVPPYWAHRSINTGDEPLISLCIYPGDAGHNYGDIQDGRYSRRRGGQ